MLTVHDVMTRSVVTVGRDTPLKEVARLLIDHSISGVPVVDSAGAVVGVVSEADLLIKEGGADVVDHRPFARLLGDSARTRERLAKRAAVTAGEAMTTPVVSIGSGRPIHEAAALMTTRRVNRLPVVDDGRLVGVVSRADLVRAYVRSDEELADTIRRDVILGVLWLDPDSFVVVVEDGVASVVGRVERRSTAEMIDRLVPMVPGVVGVNASVEWSVDDRAIEPTSNAPEFPFGPR